MLGFKSQNSEDVVKNGRYLEVRHNWIGEKLVAANIITAEQRDDLVERQGKLDRYGHEKHLWVRFGELAVQSGFCTTEQVEALPNFIGNRMVKSGLISAEQNGLLIEWQGKLRERGIDIRFGELAVSEGFCEDSDVETVMRRSIDEDSDDKDGS